MSWWLIALCGLWLLVAVHDLVAVRRLPSLPSLPPATPPADVTVVMAVRDDVVHVEESVRRLLTQQHVQLRLVVVDDRSEDGTSAILPRLAATEPRLADLKVVIFSASDEPADIVEAHEVGANSFICKPLSASGMRDAIRQIRERWLDAALPAARGTT